LRNIQAVINDLSFESDSDYESDDEFYYDDLVEGDAEDDHRK
jgi:hypothetical protein